MANLSNLDKITLFKQVPTDNFWYINGNGQWTKFFTPTPSQAIKLISTNYNLQELDEILVVQETLTITLLNAIVVNGYSKSVDIKNGQNTSFTLQAKSGETIEGESFITITQPLASVTITPSENGKWIII